MAESTCCSTSPSIYLNFHGLSANDECGGVGTAIHSTMLAFHPDELSTMNSMGYNGPGSPITHAFNFSDLPCPPLSVMVRRSRADGLAIWADSTAACELVQTRSRTTLHTQDRHAFKGKASKPKLEIMFRLLFYWLRSPEATLESFWYSARDHCGPYSSPTNVSPDASHRSNYLYRKYSGFSSGYTGPRFTYQND